MSLWVILVVLLVVLAIIFIVFTFFKSRQGTSEENEDSAKRICKTCQKDLPNDFSKSLCPYCKSFLS